MEIDKKSSGKVRDGTVSLLRVSTVRQQEQGGGIKEQRKENDEYIAKNDYSLFKEFALAETSDMGKARVEFNEALDFCVKNKKHIRVVVINRVDRFSRGGQQEYYAFKGILKRHGIRLESAKEKIDDSPSGELLEGVLASTARFDNRVRTANTISVEKALTAEGYWCRPAPTGFINVKKAVGYAGDGKAIYKPTLVRDPDDKQWSLLCYGLRKQIIGSCTPTQIANELAAKGFLMRESVKHDLYDRKKKTRVRNLVSKQSWLKICRSPIYGGMNRGKWTGNRLITGKWDGAVTPDEWHRLQKVVNKGKEDRLVQRRRALNPDVPLRRFALCPEHEKPLRGYGSVGKMKNKKHFYYDCDEPNCKFRTKAADLHKLFRSFLKGIQPKDGLIELFDAIALDHWENEFSELSRASVEAAQKVTVLKQERLEAMEMMKLSKKNPELYQSWEDVFNQKTEEIRSATDKRQNRELKEYKAEQVLGYCRHYLKHSSELWEKADVEDKNSLQRLAFPDGIPCDVLEKKRTPKLSLVYEAIKNLELAPNDVAAPRGIEPRFPG